MKRSVFYSVIFLFLAGFTFTSCEKDDTPVAPELPPMESLAMDFSDFDDPNYAGAAAKSIETSAGSMPSYQNYGHAFLNVAFWNTLSSLTIAVPVATYAAALQADPVYLGDNTWEWEFSLDVGMETYTARMVAQRLSNEEFKSEMFVSKSGMSGFEDFKWVEGVVRYDRTHATWTLYESPSSPAELLTIEWNKDWEAETSDITYTIIKEGSEENGSFIKFEILDADDFNARYSVTTSTNELVIEWNRETKAGHIKDAEKFGDEMWHCWDELLQDIEC